MVRPVTRRRRNIGTKIVLAMIAVLTLAVIAWRLIGVVSSGNVTGTIWGMQLVNGVILGGVYALIALGYTLVYGILFMINFAHGEVMMVGAYAGYFALGALSSAGVINSSPVLGLLIVFLVGTAASLALGVTLERVAYRPLRRAPRLVPLISAIGASIFLQNAALRMFGPALRVYNKPELLKGGWNIMGSGIFVTRTGAVIVVVSVLMMFSLLLLVKYTNLGRAMRAVAEDKETAALMGIDVDKVIVLTFAIGSLLAGAAGVMLGFHNGQVNPTMGFIPGIKAFTAAVLGGIGNVPGAMFGGFILGLAESLGPTVLAIPSQYKDVIAFSLLVLVLVFRPTGLLGEVLSEKRA